MQADIVQRLREYYTEGADQFCITHSICDEAADEIERLRDGFRRLRDSTDLEMGDGDMARDLAKELLPKENDGPQ